MWSLEASKYYLNWDSQVDNSVGELSNDIENDGLRASTVLRLRPAPAGAFTSLQKLMIESDGFQNMLFEN